MWAACCAAMTTSCTRPCATSPLLWRATQRERRQQQQHRSAASKQSQQRTIAQLSVAALLLAVTPHRWRSGRQAQAERQRCAFR